MPPTRRQIVPGSLDAQRLSSDLSTTTEEVPTLPPPTSSILKQEQSTSLLHDPDESKLKSKSTSNSTSSLSIDQMYSTQRKQTKLNHWHTNEYAAGCVEPTWSDEIHRSQYNEDMDDVNGPNRSCCADAASEEMDPTCGCLMVSGYVCGSSCIDAKRVGNMAILKEREVVMEVPLSYSEIQALDNDCEEGNGNGNGGEGGDGEEEKESLVLSEMEGGKGNAKSNSQLDGKAKLQKITKREIQYVVGPYWPMLLCVTYPLIFSVSIWTAIKAVFVPHQSPFIMIIWTILTFGLIKSLFNTGFKDPGILRKHREPPTLMSGDGNGGVNVTSGRNNTTWRWNDQAQSYKPRNAYYDPDCAVIVEDFDHTCPWTGTAIGKKNLKAFHSFVCLVFTCLIMDILLLTSAVGVVPLNNYYSGK